MKNIDTLPFYEKMASHYDNCMLSSRQYISNEEEIDFIKSIIKSSNPVLDLACGTGKTTKLLENEGYTTYSLDFSKNMIKEATKKGCKNTIVASTKKLPFRNNSFGAVISMRSGFSYSRTSSDALEVAKEINRVLVDDGIAIIDNPNPYVRGRSYVLKWPAGNQLVRTRCYCYTPKKIKTLLNKSRFNQVRLLGYYKNPMELKEDSPRIIAVARKQICQ
jgi:ubiquinone/menaquinone biosynthesis C-methylase UbiE